MEEALASYTEAMGIQNADTLYLVRNYSQARAVRRQCALALNSRLSWRVLVLQPCQCGHPCSAILATPRGPQVLFALGQKEKGLQLVRETLFIVERDQAGPACTTCVFVRFVSGRVPCVARPLLSRLSDSLRASTPGIRLDLPPPTSTYSRLRMKPHWSTRSWQSTSWERDQWAVVGGRAEGSENRDASVQHMLQPAQRKQRRCSDYCLGLRLRAYSTSMIIQSN